MLSTVFFFFQAEDGIRDVAVTGVQTCALPISASAMKQWQLPEEQWMRYYRPDLDRAKRLMADAGQAGGFTVKLGVIPTRSEERRVGKECRSRWSPYH